MSKFLRLNINNARLLSNIEIDNKTKKITYNYVFKTIDNPIPEHLLLNMLTDLIGEIPIPKYKQYEYTSNLAVDEQIGRKILQEIISEAYVYYHINGMNLFDFLDKESIDKPWVAYNKEENDGIIRFRGTTKDDVRNQIHNINEDVKKYVIKEKTPWGNAPWEFISGEKYQIDSNVDNVTILFTVDDYQMKAKGFYNWERFEKNFNLTPENKEEYNKIIGHIQKIMGITVHPKLIYPKYKDLCKNLCILIKNNENIANETFDFCKNGKFKTLNISTYLYTLFGYDKTIKEAKLYVKKYDKNGKETFLTTSNVNQKPDGNIRHTAIVNRVQMQAMFSFDGSIIIPLDKLTNEEEEYIIQQIKNNSGYTNCLEGGIARIEILNNISFNMDDYIQIFK